MTTPDAGPDAGPDAEPDPDAYARKLAAETTNADPTAWFEQLYAAAANGHAQVPWDRGTAHPLLSDWFEGGNITAPGSAVVVGAGPGFDAEYVSAQGFDTIAFDVSPTGVDLARRQHPGSGVDYRVADLLSLPADWRESFDLVVEVFTVQSLPVRIRDGAIEAVRDLVAPGGALVVIAAANVDSTPQDGPPWPLTRTEIEQFATGGLAPAQIDLLPVPTNPGARRWRAVFTRPHA